jgi:glycosyltransferase involved in cell wall biosynthesis
MEISVVFPAYNEEGNIRLTINRALTALRPLFDQFELLIINDCSTDQTGAIADALAAAHNQIRVIHNPRNIGQGANILAGFQHARYGLLLHNGMDYPFHLDDLAKMLPLLAEADIVVATRTGRPGYTFYRKMISIVNLKLLNLLFGLALRDYSFVQLYRKSVWDEIAPRMEARSTGFLAPEALIRAYDMGFRIQQIDIEYHARLHGQATAGKPSILVKSLRELLRFWWRRRVAAGRSNTGEGRI